MRRFLIAVKSSTPYCLFAIAQAQILQGKTSHNWIKEVTAQLAKLYSSAPTDVLAELDEAENPNAVDPFTNGSKYMSSVSRRTDRKLRLPSQH